MSSTVEAPNPVCGTYAPIDVLVIEQRERELVTIRAALTEAKVVNVLKGCDTVRDCLAIIGGPPLPDLIIVDLAVVDEADRGLLAELRRSGLQGIPVVALGGREGDEQAAVQLQADFYVRKPLTPAHVVGIVQAVEGLDLAIVKCSKGT